jgi:argininosuccinate lyase
VRLAIESSCDLSELELTELQRFSKMIEADVFDVLTHEGSLSSRKHFGGTAPVQVRAACQRARQRLSAQES